MALSENEGTSKNVMALFTMPGGFSAGYVMIRRAEFQYADSGVQISILINKYASAAARHAAPDSCISEGLGFPVPESVVSSVQAKDDRSILYPCLEAQVRYLDLVKQQSEMAAEEFTEKVQAIYDELRIENPYKR